MTQTNVRTGTGAHPPRRRRGVGAGAAAAPAAAPRGRGASRVRSCNMPAGGSMLSGPPMGGWCARTAGVAPERPLPCIW